VRASPKKSLDFIVTSVHMFGVCFRKALEANACERGGSARYFLIYVVCICMCVCSFPSKNGVKSKSLFRVVNSDARFRVFFNTLFQEVVCLSL
jgi:hypothetical protein